MKELFCPYFIGAASVFQHLRDYSFSTGSLSRGTVAAPPRKKATLKLAERRGWRGGTGGTGGRGGEARTKTSWKAAASRAESKRGAEKRGWGGAEVGKRASGGHLGCGREPGE